MEQLDLPINNPNSSKKKEQKEKLEDIKEILFPVEETDRFNESIDDNRIEFKAKEKKWFVNYKEVSFEEALRAMGNGIKLLNNDENFKKIVRYFEDKEKN